MPLAQEEQLCSWQMPSACTNLGLGFVGFASRREPGNGFDVVFQGWLCGKGMTHEELLSFRASRRHPTASMCFGWLRYCFKLQH